ncbi:hypothetical protein HanHA300_Chr04g0152071 [Helianthus annuus]|nr:hypothetical protein HanHA300_Chr04g0152071 [Helianthus annuus]KAJ0598403.1 hypothetical protein HanHA89_Chr04g0165431 [Helianthus annuus]KAJ0762662.1 hypothetical protein HanOQP8_Chr04g0163831 [Helianthus annuus]
MLLEKYNFLHTTLLILVLPGTCMVIGDGVLTPVISGSEQCLRLLATSLTLQSSLLIEKSPECRSYQLLRLCTGYTLCLTFT